jgi:nicotinamide riboside transporter PnuC
MPISLFQKAILVFFSQKQTLITHYIALISAISHAMVQLQLKKYAAMGLGLLAE